MTHGTNGRAPASSKRRRPATAPDLPALPRSDDAEKALLGSYLLERSLLDEPDCLVADGDFYLDRHRVLFVTIRDLHAFDVNFDIVTLGERLEADGTLAEVGGRPYLLELLSETPHAYHARSYAGIVRDRAARRRVIAQADAAASAARNCSVQLTDVFASLEEIRPTASVSGVRLMGSREFDDAEFEVDFLVDGFLVRGQPMIGGGPAKGCKTVVTSAVIVAGATGKSVLGYEKFSVARPFRSAFVSMESGGAAIRATVRSQCHAAGCRLSDLEGTVFWQLDSLKLTSQATLAALGREIEKRQIEFFVVDPLYLSLDLDSDDEKSLYKMGRRLGEIGKLCADTGCTISLVHHGVKRPQDPYRPMKLGDLSGAGVTEYARQWMLLSRRAEYDEDRPGHHELWLRTGGSAFPGNLVAVDIDEWSDFGTRREWRTSVRPASEAASQMSEAEITAAQIRKEAEREQRSRALVEKHLPEVVDYLRKRPEGVCSEPARKELSLRESTWLLVVGHLRATGQIVDAKVRRANKQVYDGFRLTPEDHDPPPPPTTTIAGSHTVAVTGAAQAHTPPPPSPIGGGGGGGGVCLCGPEGGAQTLGTPTTTIRRAGR